MGYVFPCAPCSLSEQLLHPSTLSKGVETTLVVGNLSPRINPQCLQHGGHEVSGTERRKSRRSSNQPTLVSLQVSSDSWEYPARPEVYIGTEDGPISS
jgi:hypothetical protein